MIGRGTRWLIAFAFALAATMPVSARAMPAVMSMAGTALQQHCPNCAPHRQTNHTQSDRMSPCPILVCAGSAVVQPARIVLPEPVVRRIAYAMATEHRWTDAVPAPDPFPPRPLIHR